MRYLNMALFNILLGWLVFLAATFSLGLLTLAFSKLELTRGERLSLGFCVGAAELSAIVLALSSLSLARKGVFTVVTVLALAAAIHFRKGLLPAAVGEGASRPALHWLWKIALAGSLLAYGAIYLRQALSPEMSPDGMSYHLAEVADWNRHHGLVKSIDMFAAMPNGLEMLFLVAFAYGRHSAASLVTFSFLLVLPFLLLLYGKRFGFATAGLVAGLAVFADPIFGVVGTCSYVDAGLAAIVFASVYFLRIWKSHQGEAALILASALAAFAVAIKYSAVFVLLIPALWILIESRKLGLRFLVRASVIPALAVILFVGPYLVRNYLWYRNPIAFFGNRIFRNRYFNISFEKTLVEFQIHHLDWRDVPQELTLGHPKLGMPFGPIFALLPLALLGLIWPEGRFLTLAGVALSLGYASNKDSRFLMPCFPLLLLASTYVFTRIRLSFLLALIVAAHLFLSWPSVMRKIAFQGWRLKDITWGEALRQVPEGVFLSEHSQQYRSATLIDRLVPPGERVLTLGWGAGRAYSTHEVLVWFASAFGESAADLFYTTWNSAQVPQTVTSFKFAGQSIKSYRLMPVSSDDQSWGINDVRLLYRGQLVKPPAATHARAWPHSWDAWMAFDESLVTRWKSWEPMHPGMFLGQDFVSPLTLDSIAVRTFPDQPPGEMILEITNDHGAKLVSHPNDVRPAPLKDLRKEAMAALSSMGIHYVMLCVFDWNHEEFLGKAPEWGLLKLGDVDGAVALFRVGP